METTHECFQIPDTSTRSTSMVTVRRRSCWNSPRENIPESGSTPGPGKPKVWRDSATAAARKLFRHRHFTTESRFGCGGRSQTPLPPSHELGSFPAKHRRERTLLVRPCHLRSTDGGL